MNDSMQDLDRLIKELNGQGYSSICFWLPAYNTGGGTWELCQIAAFLSEHSNLNIYYMDFQDGYPSSLLEGTKVEILTYTEEETDLPLSEPCVIVSNSTRAVQLKKMNPHSKMFFWHYETAPVGWDLLFLLNETDAFLHLCLDTKAMFFHDWSSYDILRESSKVDFERSYLPLFLPQKNLLEKPTGMIDDSEINVVCLGRLGYEKRQSLYKVIEQFAAYPTTRKKILHIVGDGPYRREVEQRCERHQKVIEMDFAGTIPKSDLDAYLFSHADVVFGMGLSALEGAALHIPSVVVPVSPQPIEDNWFYYVFDTKDYCMGILPEQKDRFGVPFHSFFEILDDVCRTDGKAEIGEKSYEYYMENHASLTKAVGRLLQIIVNSSFTMEKLKACIKYIPYNHLTVRRVKILNRVIKTIPIWGE